MKNPANSSGADVVEELPPTPQTVQPGTSSPVEESQVPDELAGARSLRIWYDAHWNKHATIHLTDSEHQKELYTISTRYRKPQITIRTGFDDLVVATANFHNFSNRIDLTVQGRAITLEPHGLGRSYSYTSPAFNNTRMVWKPHKVIDDLNMVLLDGKGIAIARYKPEYKGTKTGGTLEMLSECLSSDAVAEEVVVVALAVVHYKETQRTAAAA